MRAAPVGGKVFVALTVRNPMTMHPVRWLGKTHNLGEIIRSRRMGSRMLSLGEGREKLLLVALLLCRTKRQLGHNTKSCTPAVAW